MKTIGTDPDGHPISGVPDPGDHIRVLWAAEGFSEQHWDDAFLIRIDTAGLWWTPTDDASGAFWSAWSRIIQIEGPAA